MSGASSPGSVFLRLLAKRPVDPARPQNRETLRGHVSDVLRTVEVLVESRGEAALDALGLGSAHLDSVRRTLRVAALAHDLGKATDCFQSMLRRSGKLQPVRHEAISALLLLRDGPLADWILVGLDEPERDRAVAAVLGHHLRAEAGGNEPPWEARCVAELQVLAGHPDFAACLGDAAPERGPPPHLAGFKLAVGGGAIDLEPISRWWGRFSHRWRRLAEGDASRKLLAAVKAFLIAADVAGSAVPRLGADPAAWAGAVLARRCEVAELGAIAEQRLDGRPVRSFQSAVADSTARVTIARAGCGSGKTTAAYLWAARRGARKVFFCYPTTGTATEGFADYVLPSSTEGRLIHGRAEVDIERLMGSSVTEDPGWVLPAIEALSAWDVPLAVATADVVLGLMQNNRRGLFSFPALAGAAFVFDEVHSYDARMFGSLLRFLNAFAGAPMLLMTASLSPARRDALYRTLAPDEPAEILGPGELEGLPRHGIRRADCGDAVAEAVAALAGGQKVLWVANTVRRCVEVAERLAEAGLPACAYHSRFRYTDRVERHRFVVESFRRSGPALAVATQVAEMSLDLSADLLVTDLAPAPALVQRLGRLNRRITPEAPGVPRTCLVLEPASPHPYEESELEAARAFLRAVGPGPVSQSCLARCLDSLDEGRFDRCPSAWLDGGPASVPAPLRGDGGTAPFVRAEDAGRLPAAHRQVRLEIPMPVHPVIREMAGWARLGQALMAPTGRIAYSEQWGARWSD